MLTMIVYSTPLLQDWLGDDQAKRQRREIHFPSGRFGEAIEQAHGVLFLASDESSFVNGTDFVIDGAMTKVSFPFLRLPSWLGALLFWRLIVGTRHMLLLKEHR